MKTNKRCLDLLARLSLLFAIAACNGNLTPAIDEHEAPASAAGIALASALEGSWRAQGSTLGSCAADSVANPLKGTSEWLAQGHRVSIESRALAGTALDLVAVDGNTLERSASGSYAGCWFYEEARLSFDYLRAENLAGTLHIGFDWTDSQHCQDLVKEHLSGLDAPCTWRYRFNAKRLR